MAFGRPDELGPVGRDGRAGIPAGELPIDDPVDEGAA